MSTTEPTPSALAQTLERARASLFLSIFRPIGHALNNPLQGALGAVELAALQGVGVDAVRAESLASARGEVLRAASLVSGLQGMARGAHEGASTWAASLDRCASLSGALARHAGLEIVAAQADLSTQLQARAGVLDLAWLGIVEAYLRLGLARGSKITLGSELVEAKGTYDLRGEHEGGALALNPDLQAALAELDFVWRAAAGQWSLALPLIRRG